MWINLGDLAWTAGLIWQTRSHKLFPAYTSIYLYFWTDVPLFSFLPACLFRIFKNEEARQHDHNEVNWMLLHMHRWCHSNRSCPHWADSVSPIVSDQNSTVLARSILNSSSQVSSVNRVWDPKMIGVLWWEIMWTDKSFEYETRGSFPQELSPSSLPFMSCRDLEYPNNETRRRRMTPPTQKLVVNHRSFLIGWVVCCFVGLFGLLPCNRCWRINVWNWLMNSEKTHQLRTLTHCLERPSADQWAVHKLTGSCSPQLWRRHELISTNRN